ncbi:MAG: heavy-metal-associated domain-containing protein [Nanoarchaeota archaeon]
MKTFNVKGMHCTSCEMLITDALQEAGAEKVIADHKKGIVKVAGSLPDSKVTAVIKNEGYTVV